MGLENPLHIAIVLVVVLLVFGAKRLPEMGKGLGEGMRGFRSGLSGDSAHEPKVEVRQLSASEPVSTSPAASDERAREPIA